MQCFRLVKHDLFCRVAITMFQQTKSTNDFEIECRMAWMEVDTCINVNRWLCLKCVVFLFSVSEGYVEHDTSHAGVELVWWCSRLLTGVATVSSKVQALKIETIDRNGLKPV